jgi:hypothetical protein
MKYDVESDFYICNNNRKLLQTSIIHRKSASGYKSEVTVYECESCESCIHKSKCTKAKDIRKMQVSKTFIEKRERSYRNITTEFILHCIGYNINKLYSKIQNRRTQNYLHELKSTD